MPGSMKGSEICTEGVGELDAGCRMPGSMKGSEICSISPRDPG